MAKIIKIAASSIEVAMADTTRQYLAGRLQRPQALGHIDTELLEIGLTRYRERTVEKPHYHTVAHEFQYMIEGVTAYLDTESSTEHVFSAGDFYVIEPGVRYAQKSAAGTAILFIKVPPGNDKVDVSVSQELHAWFAAPIQEMTRGSS